MDHLTPLPIPQDEQRAVNPEDRTPRERITAVDATPLALNFKWFPDRLRTDLTGFRTVRPFLATQRAFRRGLSTPRISRLKNGLKFKEHQNIRFRTRAFVVSIELNPV